MSAYASRKSHFSNHSKPTRGSRRQVLWALPEVFLAMQPVSPTDASTSQQETAFDGGLHPSAKSLDQEQVSADSGAVSDRVKNEMNQTLFFHSRESDRFEPLKKNQSGGSAALLFMTREKVEKRDMKGNAETLAENAQMGLLLTEVEQAPSLEELSRQTFTSKKAALYNMHKRDDEVIGDETLTEAELRELLKVAEGVDQSLLELGLLKIDKYLGCITVAQNLQSIYRGWPKSVRAATDLFASWIKGALERSDASDSQAKKRYFEIVQALKMLQYVRTAENGEQHLGDLHDIALLYFSQCFKVNVELIPNANYARDQFRSNIHPLHLFTITFLYLMHEEHDKKGETLEKEEVSPIFVGDWIKKLKDSSHKGV